MFAFLAFLSCAAFATATPGYSSPPAYGYPPAYGGSAPPVYMPGDGYNCSRRWSACDGANYEGGKCCVGMNECVYKNDYFSLCQPVDPLPVGVIAEYKPCGNWTADVCEPLTECAVPAGENFTICVDPVHELQRSRDCSKAGVYRQCDGLKWTGPKECRGKNECTRVNDYFWMCSPSKDAGCSELWAPCGGREIQPTCCVEGTTCTFINEWFSQCLADP